MFDFRYAVEIRVPPARIWPVLLDVERWPEWTTSVTRVQRMDIGPLGLGSRTRIWQPKLPSSVWCVTSLDERNYSFTWVKDTYGFKVIARHQIIPLKTHSRVILTLAYTGLLGVVLSRLYRGLSMDYLAREGTGLRNVCETRASYAPPVNVERTGTT
jgi:hypothetical protein